MKLLSCFPNQNQLCFDFLARRLMIFFSSEALIIFWSNGAGGERGFLDSLYSTTTVGFSIFFGNISKKKKKKPIEARRMGVACPSSSIDLEKTYYNQWWLHSGLLHN